MRTVLQQSWLWSVSSQRKMLEKIGMDPETGKIDIDKVEGRTPTSDRDRMNKIMEEIGALEAEFENVPVNILKEHLADKYDMAFFFGMYDSGKYWHEGDYLKEIDLNIKLIDEVWAKYGHHKSFQGWYLSQEVSRRTKNMTKIYAEVGKHAKEVSGNLTTMVSPYIHGVKTDQVMWGDQATTVSEHEYEWNEILSNLQGVVDILAFQDGQVDYHELYDYLVVNKKLADKYGMKCWTNFESFDRDMPIRFLPIKWEKLLLKMDMARRAGMDGAITFEFSHFMSPNSEYSQAGHLYDRYCEHFGIRNRWK